MRKELYTPLKILKDLDSYAVTWMDVGKDVSQDKVWSIIKALMGELGDVPEDWIDFNGFLSWVIGKSFCKRSYNGRYRAVNERLLEIYAKHKDQGMSYQKFRNDYQDCISFGTVFRFWRKYRQCYRFDEDFMEELMDTDSVELPVEVLKRLPFSCFYLDLEDTEKIKPDLGIFVYIGFEEDTGRPNLVFYRVGAPSDGEQENRLYACRASGDEMEKWGMLEKNGKGELCICFGEDKRNRMNYGSDGTDIYDCVFFMLQAMLYLASNKPDIVESPKERYAHKGRAAESMPRDGQQKEPEVSISDVGVRYGAAIRKVKKVSGGNGAKTRERAAVGPKRKISSHVRSAHWHHYWVGRGRTERIVRWIPPTFVSGSGKELPVTIHRVKG